MIHLYSFSELEVEGDLKDKIPVDLTQLLQENAIEVSQIGFKIKPDGEISPLGQYSI